MKKLLLWATLCAPALSWAQGIEVPEWMAPDRKVQVMIVGSYHMANPGLDVVNVEADDVLTPERQAQIQEVVDLLESWAPQKVMLEVPYATNLDTLIQTRYTGYRDGSWKPNQQEMYQIGFRLAHQLDHPRVYPVDAPGEFPVEAVMAFAQAKELYPQLQEFQKAMQYFGEMTNGIMGGTVREILATHNHPDFVRMSLEIYYQYFMPFGQHAEHPGAELIGDWYTRNLGILHNLYQQTGPEDERVVLVIGSGHAGILKHLIEADPRFEYVSPYPLLTHAQ